MHLNSFVVLEYKCLPGTLHFGHFNLDPGVMFVDKTAELGLLSLLAELMVLKSVYMKKLYASHYYLKR